MDESEVVTVSRPFQRRRILISTLQWRLLIVNLLYFCVIVLILAALLFLPLALQLRSSSPDSSAENLEAANEFLFLHARLWPALFLVLGLLAFHSVIISHRVAGPLYRFQRVLKAVADGDLSVRARIRKTDYLTKEADLINEMIDALTRRVTDIEEQAAAMRAAFIDLRRARECGSVEFLDNHIHNLGVLLDHFATCPGQFRLAARVDHCVASTSALIRNE